MAGNLFQISRDYLNILDELELNGGELTPELEEALAVTQENFRTKLGNYRKLIANTEGEIQIVAEEIARLQGTKKTKDNTVKKLKERMLEAVVLFGDDGKTGNKIVSLPDCKIFTRNTKVVELDEEKANLLLELFIDWYRELWDNDMLISPDGNSITINPTDCINEINKRAHERNLVYEDFNFTVDDLCLISVEFTTKLYAVDLLKSSNQSIINNYFEQEHISNIKKDISKTLTKSIIEDTNCEVHIAKMGTNISLQIK